MNWAKRRQVTLFFIVLAIVAIPLVYVYIKQTAPSCFDKKQNQDEEGIDCGGKNCEKCLGEIRNLEVIWAKSFKVTGGRYEAASIVSNPNAFLGISNLRYAIKLYDADNILIAVREGITFINPGERVLIFESSIGTGERVPAKTSVELMENLKWERVEREKPNLTIVSKEFTSDPSPRLAVQIENKTLLPARDISVSAILSLGDGSVLGVSSTKIDLINSNSIETAVLTWGGPFVAEPEKIDILVRTRIVSPGLMP